MKCRPNVEQRRPKGKEAPKKSSKAVKKTPYRKQAK